MSTLHTGGHAHSLPTAASSPPPPSCVPGCFGGTTGSVVERGGLGGGGRRPFQSPHCLHPFHRLAYDPLRPLPFPPTPFSVHGGGGGEVKQAKPPSPVASAGGGRVPTPVLWSTRRGRQVHTTIKRSSTGKKVKRDSGGGMEKGKSKTWLPWKPAQSYVREGDEEDTLKNYDVGGACIAWHACKACTQGNAFVGEKRRIFWEGEKQSPAEIFAHQSSPRTRFLVPFSLQIAEKFFMIPAFPVQGIELCSLQFFALA